MNNKTTSTALAGVMGFGILGLLLVYYFKNQGGLEAAFGMALIGIPVAILFLISLIMLILSPLFNLLKRKAPNSVLNEELNKGKIILISIASFVAFCVLAKWYF